MFIRRLTPSNPDAFDKHGVTLVPSLSSLQTTMCWLWNPDENDLCERDHIMNVTFAIRFLVRCHRVALLLVPADLPPRMPQQPCQDRFVSTKSFTIPKAHLAVCTNCSSLLIKSLDGTLSRIGIRTVFRCCLQFHQISSHVFHLVGERHRGGLSVTSQSYMFVKETFDEFDQSSGRVLGRPLSHKGDGFHEEQICVHSNQCRGIFLFCLSPI